MSPLSATFNERYTERFRNDHRPSRGPLRTTGRTRRCGRWLREERVLLLPAGI